MSIRCWAIVTIFVVIAPFARAAEKLPPELNLVPRGAAAYVSIRIADIWESEATRSLRTAVVKEHGQLIADIERSTGLRPTDIDRIGLILPAFDSPTPMLIVTTVEPYDRNKLVEKMKAVDPGFSRRAFIRPQRFDAPPIPNPNAKVDIDAAYLHPFGRRSQAVVLIDAKSFALLEIGDSGRDKMLLPLIAQVMQSSKPGPQSLALESSTGKFPLVIGLDVASLATSLANSKDFLAMPITSLAEVKEFAASVELGEPSKVRLSFRFADAAAAKKGTKTVEAIQTLFPDILTGIIRSSRNSPDSIINEKFLEQMQKSLADATIENAGNIVTLTSTIPIESVLPRMVSVVAYTLGESGRKTEASNHLKVVGLAMHNFHDVFERLPGSSQNFQNPKFPVSWRVNILPYIEQENVYRMYRFDEPWDSENNKKLIPLMPKIYELPGSETPEKGQTYFQLFTGPETMFQRDRGSSIVGVTDGTSNTIMVAEAGTPVIWTRPDDLVYDGKKPLPKLGGHFRNGFLVCMGDGSVRFIKSTTPEPTLRAMITARGGEVFNLD